MKKINLTSDRVRLPSNTAWFPTQLNRALTKCKFPFPKASTIHTDWGSKIFPLFLLWEQKTEQQPHFVENSKKNGWENGAMLRVIDQ